MPTEVTKPNDLGRAIEYYDSRGVKHAALITNIWGPQCVNLAFVTTDGQEDHYGRKLGRNTSVMHGSVQQAHGNYWMLPGEVRDVAVK